MDAVVAMIRQAVESFTLDAFRSSDELKSALKLIVEYHIMPEIRRLFWGKQILSFHIRLDALMKLAVSYLCVPTFSSFLGFGISLDQSDNGKRKTLKDELCECIVELFSILLISEECIMKRGISVKSCHHV